MSKWTQEFLNNMRNTGDELADSTVREIFKNKTQEERDEAIHNVVKHTLRLHDLDPALEAYFNTLDAQEFTEEDIKAFDKSAVCYTDKLKMKIALVLLTPFRIADAFPFVMIPPESTAELATPNSPLLLLLWRKYWMLRAMPASPSYWLGFGWSFGLLQYLTLRGCCLLQPGKLSEEKERDQICFRNVSEAPINKETLQRRRRM